MLYRQPRPFAARLISAVLSRIVETVTSLRRTGADEAYLDALNGHALRDLGIRRVVTRDDTYYR
jgi:uncharacterized protein YjiS (DUF1127 family)